MRTLTGRLVQILLAVVLVACGGTPGEATDSSPTTAVAQRGGAAGTIRLYTSVTQDTVDAVLQGFQSSNPDVKAEVFRAPTGELNARLAAEQRSGGVKADVLWLTDPLSMYAYDEQDLLAEWTPNGAEAIPEQFRTERFWGTRILNLVIVHRQGLQPAPTGWQDLADDAYSEPVAFPDPAFAGSSFAALGYFALDEEFGFDYYRALRANGAVEVQAPDEVITGVAEGRFSAGMSLDKSVRDAAEEGAPIELVWPEPGAIALYSPIAVIRSTTNEEAAQALASFVLTEPAQAAIASTGWQPVLPGVEGPPMPTDAEQVFPDWEAAFGRQDELLSEYRSSLGD
ncbi:MAG: extracellular solute-binding protein [Egibacteraceae bacterium]